MRIDQQTLSVLSGVEYVPGFPRRVRIVEKLDRSDYTRVNKILEALGGKWSRKVQAHEFGSDARPRIEHALILGEVETGQDVGHFPTPAPLARQLVEVSDPQPGQCALEPSAGSGRIVNALLEHTAGLRVWAIERNEERRMALILRNHQRLSVIDSGDFLDAMGGRLAGFDRIVMNPPFCVVGRGDHLDHVRHAAAQLEPDGVLVSVLPSSVKFRRDRRYREFRAWGEGLAWAIDDLPDGSFKESGTGVCTVMVRIRRGAGMGWNDGNP